MDDVRFKTDKYYYHERVVALITQDDKYLIQNITGYDYFILPGGHVHIGESSIDALKRELKEEVGIDYKKINLICLHENFYMNKDRQEHWIEMYFKVHPLEKLPEENFVKVENDNGETKVLNFYWKTREEIKQIDLKPITIKNMITLGNDNKFNHIIREE